MVTQPPEGAGFTRIFGSSNDPTALPLAAFLLLAGIWLIPRLAQSYIRNLPPGPRGLPLIGDVIHITDHEWLASPQRRDDYGEVMYINALGRGMLIINSQHVAIDLLEKRSTTYSDRPHYISAGDFMTKNMSFSILPYGDLLRQFRRVAAEGFSKSAVQHFHPIQNREAIMLALALMKSPPNLEKHFHRHAWSIMLSVDYHLPPVESEDDPCIVGVENHVRRFLREVQPGTRLVEYFPWLRYVPSRFAKWKRDAQYWFIQDSLRFQRLLGKVTEDLANGIDRPSFGATIIKTQSKHGLSELEQAWLVGVMLSAGGETVSASLQWWILAMLVYPNVQARAHAELDDVVGRGRPPTFADIPFLPYIRAMVKETLRWSPIAPFGVPHASTADDWYEGMFIPKGTICLQNIRLLNFDPEVFGGNVAEFDPTRYLDEKGQVKTLIGGREEGHMSFGFGRRVCPGRYVAEGTLVIDLATLLWAMRFERPEGSQGELDVRTLVRSGPTARPVPFECKAVPRFTEAEALLNEALSMYE
ncbi:cytochrome P450 [Lactarius pseudohatsudake]|nr:cytochrome P450 [Lactarius pseudohatsudake]